MPVKWFISGSRRIKGWERKGNKKELRRFYLNSSSTHLDIFLFLERGCIKDIILVVHVLLFKQLSNLSLPFNCPYTSRNCFHVLLGRTWKKKTQTNKNKNLGISGGSISFTLKRLRLQTSLKKISNLFSLNFEKQIVIGESTAQEVSFGSLHHRILSKHSKLETCLHNIINSTVWKSLANNVYLNGHTKGF